MEGLRKSEKFMSEYKLSIFLILAMLAMLFFTAGMTRTFLNKTRSD